MSQFPNPPSLFRVGGLGPIVRELRDLFIVPLMFPDVFKAFGIAPPKGVLLYGPPGTGKTLLARSLAEEIQQRWDDVWRELCPKFRGLISLGSREQKDKEKPPPPPVIELFSAEDIMGHEGGEANIHGISI